MTTTIAANSVWPWVEPIAPPQNSAAVDQNIWPKISIVTPNFNYAGMIETTLRSVLMQAYPNLEYIVIDGGSTDGSVEVIRKYESKLAYFVSERDEGQYSAINKGFSKATGDIFGWVNSDDIYLPWTLRTVGAIFAQHPEIDWIIGQPSTMQDGVPHELLPIRPFPRQMIRAGFFYYGPAGVGPIQQESCFWRKGLWQKAGPLRTEFRFAADYDLWTRFAAQADLVAVSTLLGGFSKRGGENRSTAGYDQYLAEIMTIRQKLAEDRGIGQAKILRDIGLWHKARQITGLKRLARKCLMEKYRGPMLTWDFTASRYKMESVSFFS